MTYARNLARLARQGAPVVDTAQALRDMPIYGGLFPKAVQTLGVYSPGDGGGQTWAWDAASTAADNLGTVLLPTGHTGAGRWVSLLNDGEVNAAWFGGDVQAALDTLLDVRLDADIEVTAPVRLYDRQRLHGSGQITQVMANANCINISGLTGAIVAGMRIVAVGSRSGLTNGMGVSIEQGSTKCHVIGCHISGHRGHGVGITNSSDNSVIDCLFTDCPATDADYHTQLGHDIGIQWSSSRNVVIGNRCISGNGVGIAVQSVSVGDVVDENVISGNVVSGCRLYGIMAYRLNPTDSVEGTVIVGNVVSQISGRNPLYDAEPGKEYIYGTGIYVQGAERTTVTGNTIRETHTANKAGIVDLYARLAPGAIGTTNVSSVVVSGNTIRDAGYAGIYITDPNELGVVGGVTIVDGNVVHSTVHDGITAPSRSNIVVADNAVTDAGRFGIRVAGTEPVVNISITDNVIVNSVNVGLSVVYAEAPLISGNLVVGSMVHGITANQCNNYLICNNVIRNQVVRGIQVTDDCGFGTISSNQIAGSGTSNEGIRADANCLMLANSISGCVATYAGTWGPVRTLPINDATPSVKGGSVFVTANTIPTTISNFDDGDEGQLITICIRDVNTTMDFSGTTNIHGNNGVDWTPPSNSVLRATKHLGGWYCTTEAGS